MCIYLFSVQIAPLLDAHGHEHAFFRIELPGYKQRISTTDCQRVFEEYAIFIRADYFKPPRRNQDIQVRVLIPLCFKGYLTIRLSHAIHIICHTHDAHLSQNVETRTINGQSRPAHASAASPRCRAAPLQSWPPESHPCPLARPPPLSVPPSTSAPAYPVSTRPPLLCP